MLQSPSEKQIRDLIFDRQIVSNGRLVTQYEHFNPDSFRILDQPLAILITDELIHGSWTIDELAEKFGINNNDVRSVLLPLMSDPSAFEGCYIPRRTGRDEREGHRVNSRYSYVPIPINARIFDPILGFSLLGWRSFLEEVNSTPLTSKTSELDKQYCEKISSFWDIPPQKVIDYYSKEKLYFAPSVYGILPVVENDNIYTSIKKKIEEHPDLLSKRFRRRHLEKERLRFEQYLMQGPGTIPELQSLVVLLYDILSFCSNEGLEDEYKEFLKINFDLFQMVFNVSEISSIKIEENRLSGKFQSTIEENNGIVNLGDSEVSKVVNFQTIGIGNGTAIRVVESEVANVADSHLTNIDDFFDSKVVNYHTVRIGNMTILKAGEIEIANVTDSHLTEKNDPIPEFRRTNLPIKEFNKLMQDLESQDIGTRISVIRRIKKGQVSTDINLLKKALKDDSWIVQIEALSVIKKMVVPLSPNDLIPCIKSSDKRVRRAAVIILSSIGTQEALSLLVKIAIRCDRIIAKQAINAIVSGFSIYSKPVLMRINEFAVDQEVRRIALEKLQNLKGVDETSISHNKT